MLGLAPKVHTAADRWQNRAGYHVTYSWKAWDTPAGDEEPGHCCWPAHDSEPGHHLGPLEAAGCAGAPK